MNVPKAKKEESEPEVVVVFGGAESAQYTLFVRHA